MAEGRREPGLARAQHHLRAARPGARRGDVLSVAVSQRPEAATRRTILVVDDTPLIRELAVLFLARAGRVLTAASGDEAEALADVVRPDLVFADLGMRGTDGAALCRWLKESALHAHVPVVLLVGSDEAQERERAVRAGADDVIAKPIERLQLLETARRFLAGAPRGLPRIAIAAPTRLRQSEAEWCGTARNLSRGGVFVESPRVAPQRAELGLAVTLPETTLVLTSTALVVWTRSVAPDAVPGMGLRFLGLDRRSARALADYVDERIPALVLAHRGGGT